MAKVTRLSLDGGGGLDRRRLHLREISDEADAPLDTVGQDLRKARQRKGEDLAQISSALKIRKGYLEALEESDFGSLPGRTYAIGFVRSYAEYLGLDAPQCVERLKIEIAGRDDERDTSKVAMAPEQDRRLPQGSVILIILLLIALVYGVYYLVSSNSRSQVQQVTPVPARLEAQAELNSTPAPEPSTSAPSDPAVIQATVTPTPAAPVAAPPATQVAATPAAPPPTAASAELPQGQKLGTGNANSRLTLRVHKSVHVTVVGADPGRPYLNRDLNPGDTYAVPNLIGLKITTPDAGAVEVILDGASAGYVGKDGAAAAGLSLNPQDVVDRQAQ